jgi:hypothetical protein
MCFAGLMLGSVALLLEFGVHWKFTWTAAALSRAQVFSYRNTRQGKTPEAVLAYDTESAGD